MKKIFALMLIIPMLALVSCNKDDADSKDFFFPVMKWGATPSYVMKQESHKLITNDYDPSDNSRQIGYEGDGKVLAILYMFDDEELEQSALGMDVDDLDDFEDWAEDKGYQFVMEYQNIEMYLSKDGKTMLVIGSSNGMGVGIFESSDILDDMVGAPARSPKNGAALVEKVEKIAKKLK